MFLTVFKDDGSNKQRRFTHPTIFQPQLKPELLSSDPIFDYIDLFEARASLKKFDFRYT